MGKGCGSPLNPPPVFLFYKTLLYKNSLEVKISLTLRCVKNITKAEILLRTCFRVDGKYLYNKKSYIAWFWIVANKTIK